MNVALYGELMKSGENILNNAPHRPKKVSKISIFHTVKELVIVESFFYHDSWAMENAYRFRP